MVLELPNWNELENHLHLGISTIVVKSECRLQTDSLNPYTSFTIFAV